MLHLRAYSELSYYNPQCAVVFTQPLLSDVALYIVAASGICHKSFVIRS
jgi:hypothetical protein